MPKVMHISIAIELAGDEWEQAVQKVALKPVWDQFLVSLGTAGIKFESLIDTSEVRAKPAATGARRGRPPRQPRPSPATNGGAAEPELPPAPSAPA